MYTGRAHQNALRVFKFHPAPYHFRTCVLHFSVHFRKGQSYKRKGCVWASTESLDGTTVVFPKLSNLFSMLDFLWPCGRWLLPGCTPSSATLSRDPRAWLPTGLQQPLRLLCRRREETFTLTVSIIAYGREHLIRGNYFL